MFPGHEQFEKDLDEAHAHWQSKTQGGDAVSLEQWVMIILRKPVYDLLGEKRTAGPQQR